MVLYYGLLALETANNTIATATGSASSITTTASPAVPLHASDRTNLTPKQKYLSNSIGKMPLSSSSSSSNSWIYTEDLRKRFEERYGDFRYVFVPVYIDRKTARRHHSHSTTAIPAPQINSDNAWMYSRSLRDHLHYSSSKMSLPLRTNMSSSICCVTNPGFTRDELPLKKDSKTRFFKRSSSAKEKSSITLSSASLPFSPLTSSSTSSFTFPTNNLVRHRTSDVVEEEDDEGIDDENHSIPLIKQEPTVSSSSFSSSRPTTTSSSDNKPIVPSASSSHSESALSPLSSLSSSSSPSQTKATSTQNNRLTRLRSFFFKSSSAPSARTERQREGPFLSSSTANRISRT